MGIGAGDNSHAAARQICATHLMVKIAMHWKTETSALGNSSGESLLANHHDQRDQQNQSHLSTFSYSLAAS
jgi:hypothetical protein